MRPRPYPGAVAKTDSPRAERVLAYMAISIFGLCVLAFLALILAPTIGVTDYSGTIWPFVLVFPLIGLPITFLLLVFVIALNWRRRR
jgi:hypothetical protein